MPELWNVIQGRSSRVLLAISIGRPRTAAPPLEQHPERAAVRKQDRPRGLRRCREEAGLVQAIPEHPPLPAPEGLSRSTLTALGSSHDQHPHRPLDGEDAHLFIAGRIVV
jgi:hypothetical protein